MHAMQTVSLDWSAAAKCSNVAPDNMHVEVEPWIDKMTSLPLQEYDRSMEEKILFRLPNKPYADSQNRTKNPSL